MAEFDPIKSDFAESILVCSKGFLAFYKQSLVVFDDWLSCNCQRVILRQKLPVRMWRLILSHEYLRLVIVEHVYSLFGILVSKECDILRRPKQWCEMCSKNTFVS